MKERKKIIFSNVFIKKEKNKTIKNVNNRTRFSTNSTNVINIQNINVGEFYLNKLYIFNTFRSIEKQIIYTIVCKRCCFHVLY